MVNKISLLLRQFRVYYMVVVGFCMFKIDHFIDWMTAAPIISLTEWQIVLPTTAAASLLGVVAYAGKNALQALKKDEADE